MRAATPTPVSETARAPVVDLEMLYESWGFQYAQQIEGVLEAAPRVWRWLQQQLRKNEVPVATEELLSLPQPVLFPLSLQHMDFIADNFADIKTELQLMHGAVDEAKTELQRVRDTVDELHKQEKKRDLKLDRLQRQVKNISAKPQEARNLSLDVAAEKAAQTDSEMKPKSRDRGARSSSDMSKLELIRLETPVILDRNHMDDIMNYLKNFLSDRLAGVLDGTSTLASQEATEDNSGDHQDPQQHGPDDSQILQLYQVAARGDQ